MGDKGIDHIIPLCYYDLRSPVDQMRCFNWRNTQLLSPTEKVQNGTSLPPNAALCEMKEVWPESWWGPECDAEFEVEQ